MSARELRMEALAAQGLAEALREAGGDDEAVEISLDSETSFTDVARAVARDVVESEANAEAAKAVAKTYRDRASRLEQRAQRGRGALLAALEVVGLKKLALPEATVSAGCGQPGVLLTDEALVPIAFRKADPRVHDAFLGLLRAASLLAADGQEEAAKELQATAHALLDLYTIDRKGLAEALKAGREIPGAQLSNGAPWLTLRTK